MITLGWDVAQTTDSSIIAVISYDNNPAMYWIRRIVRLPRGMPYDQQVAAVRELFFQYQSPKLIIDRTGVGLPICDMIVAGGLQPVQVSLTSGDLVNQPEPGKINLPKKDMVAALTKVIQERRIKVVAGCENAGLFRAELKNFQLKVSASGHNTYNAAPGQHDDTITAVGLCLWDGEKGGQDGGTAFEEPWGFGGSLDDDGWRHGGMTRTSNHSTCRRVQVNMR
jgi:hypothetical protein